MTFKKEFWALLSIFLLPIGLGTLFFYLNPGYFSQNTVNYGQLISPVIVTEKSDIELMGCLLYTSPSPRDQRGSRMPSSA